LLVGKDKFRLTGGGGGGGTAAAYRNKGFVSFLVPSR
jgi:hypothetical protein